MVINSAFPWNWGDDGTFLFQILICRLSFGLWVCGDWFPPPPWDIVWCSIGDLFLLFYSRLDMLCLFVFRSCVNQHLFLHWVAAGAHINIVREINVFWARKHFSWKTRFAVWWCSWTWSCTWMLRCWLQPRASLSNVSWCVNCILSSGGHPFISYPFFGDIKTGLL